MEKLSDNERVLRYIQQVRVHSLQRYLELAPNAKNLPKRNPSAKRHPNFSIHHVHEHKRRPM